MVLCLQHGAQDEESPASTHYWFCTRGLVPTAFHVIPIKSISIIGLIKGILGVWTIAHVINRSHPLAGLNHGRYYVVWVLRLLRF